MATTDGFEARLKHAREASNTLRSAIATVFDTRSASLASAMNKNGMTMGNVDRKLNKQMARLPSQSLFVSRGRAGSGSSRNCVRRWMVSSTKSW